jgi:putative redox protein
MAKPVIVLGRGSFKTEVTAGPHTFILDEPVEAGGTDQGPTPYDALAAALGGCTAMTLHFYAKREKIPLEGVDIRVSHDRQHASDCAECVEGKEEYIHVFEVELSVMGDDLTQEQKETLLEIAKRCPVAKTLGARIRIEERLVE